jgi:outer membrane cobalamin receptor
MKSSTTLFFFMICGLSFGQVIDQELPEVKVTDVSTEVIKIIRLEDRISILKRAAILELQAEDVGQLLQKMEGVQVKSYGGLGGMKTISVRGIGGQHTQLIVDGFALTQDQSGQVNLGQIQTENVETVSMLSGKSSFYLAPASSFAAGNVLSISTFENTFSSIKNELRLTQKIGSFGQTDSYLGFKHCSDKWLIAASGKYRMANGEYPFSVRNGSSVYEGVRSNNHYEDANGVVSVSRNFNNRSKALISYRTWFSDQELPGAVILYNNNSVQTLNQLSHRIQASYSFQLKQIRLHTFAVATISNMEYTDSSYLNAAGGMFSQYINKSVNTGVNAFYSTGNGWQYSGGTEQQMSLLESTMMSVNSPIRQHNFSFVSVKHLGRIFRATAQLSSQYILDHSAVSKSDEFHVNPFVQLETKEFGKRENFEFYTFYRNSFRMPSFNELYYNNIGNLDLLPEKANQFAIGAQHKHIKGKLNVRSKLNLYYNLVANKIVAVPTKNLFIWSMQNVGKVQVFGFDVSTDIYLKINDKSFVNSIINYTFQSVIDVTDNTSPTYRHQVAYLPVHSGNWDISYHYKKHGIRSSIYANSLRYSLNENTQANKVDGFILADLSVFTALTIKKHEIRLQFSCKNILNSSYAYVRYYVMPGRNYLLSLNYALRY